MADLTDPAVNELLTKPNHAVLTTFNGDGSIHSAVVWLNLEDGQVAINSQRGRKWPTNLERDPRANLTVLDESNPYEYVVISGDATEAGAGAEEHIDTLAQKYINQETYPWRVPGTERVKFFVTPDKVRHVKAG